MDLVLLVVGLVVAWLVVATLLAFAVGRTVAVARVREEHRPPRWDAHRSVRVQHSTVVLRPTPAGRSR